MNINPNIVPDTSNPVSNSTAPISNGTMSEIVKSGQCTDIATNAVDTLSGGELAVRDVIDGTYSVPVRDGKINLIHYEDVPIDSPTTSTTAIQKTTTNTVNSNISKVERGQITQVYNTSVDNTTGKITISSAPKTGSFANAVGYFATVANQAVIGVQVAAALGKTIDSVLYNSNPDFWDANGMSALNPETWESLTYGDDSINATLFNMLFGFDGQANGQAYIDEDAFAYLACWMAQNGAFDIGDSYIKTEDSSFGIVNMPVMSGSFSTSMSFAGSNYYRGKDPIVTGTGTYIARGAAYGGRGATAQQLSIIKDVPYKATAYGSRSSVRIICANTYLPRGTNCEPRGWWARTYDMGGDTGAAFTLSTYTYNGQTVYYYAINGIVNNVTSNFLSDADRHGASEGQIAWSLVYDTPTSEAGVDGIYDQPNATLPDVSTWTTPDTALTSLQQQYPELWDEALTYDHLQPDGTVKEHTYIPVPYTVPSSTPNPWTDTQPYIDPNVNPNPQTNPQINLDDWPSPDVNPLTRTLTEPTSPYDTPTVPENPTDTGTGETPVPALPEGTASALWSVYHPTQAQVDAFGGWLWTGNIITQIQQLLQNPMDGIITLHKVFAPPVDAGTGTIVIGRLDSEVPSAVVNQQYVEVDCGFVDCSEQFGNVFDYVGTKVSLYLPFIGIIPLNVSEVMRSTINIKYGVDVFTGACLAMVYVSRDGNTVNMYQYSGVASVEYPITAGLHMGILNSIIGVASGIAMIGGTTNPMGGIIGAVSIANGAIAADTVSQSHSGGFSGNAGAMGIKKPYLIIERPQTKVASTFSYLDGYPTNYSVTLGSCNNHVKCSTVHVSGINATEKELRMIESLLKEGVEV